jgi:hypothetical protein
MQAREDSQAQIDSDWWATLVAGLLHPVQVAIIESLQWIGEPLSSAQLAEIGDMNNLERSRLVHHLRRLHHLRAIEPAERPQPKNAATIRFRLVADRTNDE